MVGAADNGVAVDELFGECCRLLAALLAVRTHVVTIMQISKDLLLVLVGRTRDLAVHDREASEETGGRTPEFSTHRGIVVAHQVDVGTEAE